MTPKINIKVCKVTLKVKYVIAPNKEKIQKEKIKKESFMSLKIQHVHAFRHLIIIMDVKYLSIHM
jgi:hypothetical protein